MSSIKRQAKTNSDATAASASASRTGAFAMLVRVLRAKGSGAPARPLAGLLPALVVGIFLAVAPAAQASFGLDHFSAAFTDAEGQPVTLAGSHPFQMETSLHFKTKAGNKLEAAAKDIIVSQPAGFIGNPTAVQRCSSADFLTPFHLSTGDIVSSCPDAAAVGTVEVQLAASEELGSLYGAVYDLAPPPGVAAKLGFWIENFPITVELGVNEDPPYNVVGGPTNITQTVEVVGSVLTLWGNPGDSRHDSLRGRCINPTSGESIASNCKAGISVPFLTVPRSCGAPLVTSYEADSWSAPGVFDKGSVSGKAMRGCGSLGFAPSIAASPTSRAAESSSGLDFAIATEDQGLLNPEGLANADIEKTVVTLPEGMTANPSSANGLETCTEAQLAAESPWTAPGEGPTYTPPGAGCPDASKLGTIEVETPILDEIIKGSLYLAKPYENPSHTLLGLYMVIKSAQRGVIFKIPLKVEPDSETGRLVTTAEDLPQWPFSHFRLHFREGARSPLVTPPTCGTHTVKALLYPSSGAEPVESSSSFEIISGPNGSACPSGGQPFNPGFEAGSKTTPPGPSRPSTCGSAVRTANRN